MQPTKDKKVLFAPFLSESNDENGPKTNFDNNQRSLIHNIEDDDVPPPIQSEPPKNNETTQPSRLKKCFDSDRMRKMVDIILFCFFLIFVFGVFVLIIALSAYHFNQTETNLSPLSGALSYITFNIDSHPILDIKIQNNNIPCPENYDSMVLGTWPGTVDGCLCGLVLQRGPCDKSGDNPPDAGCDDISSRDPINMFDWREDKWCVLRAKPENQYNKAVECIEGFRKCSPGVCILESLNCPVTNIRKEGDNFTIEIVERESPMVDVRITPNNISCFGVESFARGLTTPYILINEDEWGCSKYGLDDGYSFFLDSQKQEEVFDQNDLPLTVLELIDYRKVYENTDAVLSYRKRLNVAEKDFCLNLDTELLERASTDDMQNFMSQVLIAGIVINSILCLWVLTFIVIFTFCRSIGQQQSNQAKILFGGSLVIGLMRTIDIIVMFGGMIYYRRKTLEIKEYFGEIGEKRCFLDEKTQSVLNDYQAVGDDVSRILLKYSIFLFVVSIMTIFPSFCLFWRSRKRTL